MGSGGPLALSFRAEQPHVGSGQVNRLDQRFPHGQEDWAFSDMHDLGMPAGGNCSTQHYRPSPVTPVRRNLRRDCKSRLSEVLFMDISL